MLFLKKKWRFDEDVQMAVDAIVRNARIDETGDKSTQ